MNTMVNYDAIPLIPAISTSGDITGVAVDLANYDITRGLKVYVDVGEVTTSGTLDFKIQNGATSTPATDLDTASFTQVTDSTGSQEFQVKTNLRYLRAVATLSTGTYTFAAVLLAPKRSS